MKILPIQLLLMIKLITTSLIAQPIKSNLSGPILLEDSYLIAQTSNLETSFLPRNISSISESKSILDPATKRPELAMLSSAILPGSGQAINGKWNRAAVYLLAEGLSIAYYVHQNTKAKNNERAYKAYADKNWSPLAYAKWLIDYSNAHDLNQNLDEFINLSALVNNLEPDFEQTSNDWSKLGTRGLSLVRKVEQNTIFIKQDGTERSEFSHVLQDFGSQQYYELMSKYYQFQPGWKDFYVTKANADGRYYGFGDKHIPFGYTWDNSMITANFMEGRDRSAQFNQNYRNAGNILKFLLVNHVISAFDAFFTVKLKNSRLETQTSFIAGESFSLIWHF